jgi:hypothetical protein
MLKISVKDYRQFRTGNKIYCNLDTTAIGHSQHAASKYRVSTKRLAWQSRNHEGMS